MSIGIDFILRASTGAFTSALATAGNATEKLRKSLMGKFEGRDLARGLATAFGLSVDKIADKFARLWTGMSEEAEENYKKLGDLTDTLTEKTLEAGRAKLTDEQRYQLALIETERLVMRIAANQGKTTADQIRLTEDKIALLGKQADAEQALAKIQKDAADKAEKAAKAEKENQERWATEEEKNAARLKAIADEEADAAKEEEKRELDHAAAEVERINMRTEEAAEEAAVKKTATEAEIKRQNELSDLQRGLTVLVKDQHGQEVAISAEKLKQLGAMQAAEEAQARHNLLLNDTIILMGKAYGTSRNPNDLERASTEELQELIEKNKKEIALIEGNKGRGLTAGADVATNFLPQGIVQNRLQTDIQRAQANLDMRNSLQRDNAIGGKSFARSNFQGDPLQFDKLFDQFVKGQSANEKIATSLEEIRKQFKQGIPTVLMGNDS